MDGQPAEPTDTAPIEAGRQRAAQLWHKVAGDAPLPEALKGPGGDPAAAHAAIAALPLQPNEVVAAVPRLTGLMALQDAAKLHAMARGRPVPARVAAEVQEPPSSVCARLTKPAEADRGQAVAVNNDELFFSALPTSTVYNLD